MKTAFNFLLALVCMLLFSCQKMEEGRSGDEISFSAGYSVSAVPASTKVTLFGSDEDFKSKAGMGGFFRVEAYKNVDDKSTSENHFTAPTTVMWHDDTQQEKTWRFYNLTDLVQRYWPQTYNLDFLAYMPLERASTSTADRVVIKSDQNIDPATYMTGPVYSDVEGNKGPVFTCTGLPLTAEAQAKVKEFIYAWKPNQSYATQTNSGGKVELDFVHPFSAVSIKIDGAHAGTVIHSVGFKSISNDGTFNAATNQWIPGTQSNNLIISAEHHIPNDIQIGHVYGPYLVVPQNHGSAVKITINYTWRNIVEKEVDVALNSSWVSGKKYTYSVILGDMSEDVKVVVSVDPWVAGTNQELEVK